MPDEPMTASTQDLANTEYDAERWARVGEEKFVGSNAPLPVKDDAPEVGLSQKGTDEAAVVKRETEI